MPPELFSLIDSVVDKYDAELVDLRRDLHAHPELSWAETRTTELLAAAGRAGRVAGDPAAADRVRRRPRRLGPAGGAAGRPGRPAGRGHHRSTRGPAPCPASPTRAATTSTPPPCSAPPWRWPRRTPAGCCGGRVRLLFQPAEEVMPGGALHLMELGVARGRGADLRAALRPRRRRRAGRAAPRAADQRRGPPRGPPRGHGRAHLAPAPHRGPHLRAGQGHHRAARRPVAPLRPALRGERGVGHRARRRRRATSSRERGLVAGTVRILDAGRLGRLRADRARAGRTRSSRRTA